MSFWGSCSFSQNSCGLNNQMAGLDSYLFCFISSLRLSCAVAPAAGTSPSHFLSSYAFNSSLSYCGVIFGNLLLSFYLICIHYLCYTWWESPHILWAYGVIAAETSAGV